MAVSKENDIINLTDPTENIEKVLTEQPIKAKTEDAPDEIIELGNIKLELDKQKTDSVNTTYSCTIAYSEFENWLSKRPINGFRPGNTPYQEESQKEFLRNSLGKILPLIKIKDFFSINYVQETFIEKEPIKITVIIENKPEIPNVAFSDYSIKKYTGIINDKDIETTIERYLEDNSAPSSLILDKPAQEGDFVKLEITNLAYSNKTVEETRLGFQRLNPELESRLIGQKAGFVTIHTINDKLSFEVKIIEVKEAHKPTKAEVLSQLKLENDEQLQQKVKEDLSVSAENISKNLLAQSIFKIIAELDFHAPASVLNREYRDVYSQTLFRLQYDKTIDLETFIKLKLNQTLAAFENNIQKGALFNAKLKLFLNNFAMQNNIEATPDEINAAITARAKYFKNGITEAREHFANDEEARYDLFEAIIHPKTIEKIETLINIEEQEPVSLEELEKLNINSLTYTKTTK